MVREEASLVADSLCITNDDNGRFLYGYDIVSKGSVACPSNLFRAIWDSSVDFSFCSMRSTGQRKAHICWNRKGRRCSAQGLFYVLWVGRAGSIKCIISLERQTQLEM